MLLAASGFAVAPALVLARGGDPPEPPNAHPVVTGLGWLRQRGGAPGCSFLPRSRFAQSCAVGLWMDDRVRRPLVPGVPGLACFASSLGVQWWLVANLQLRLRIGVNNPR